MFWQPLELRQSDFSHTPEAFDAVDVNLSSGEFILRMIDTEMTIPEIDKAVVAAPAIAVKTVSGLTYAPYNPYVACALSPLRTI